MEAVGLGIIDSQHVLRVTEQAEVRRDCAGIVRRTGSDRSSKLQIGDRVCVLGASLCQSYARTSHDPVALVPDNMTFEQAATLPFRSWLALYLVNEVAGLTKHRSILIHGGEDPTGQLALRFAQEAKTRVYATASSGEFESALRNKFAIPESLRSSTRFISGTLCPIVGWIYLSGRSVSSDLLVIGHSR